ncbi:hypothetical protein D3C72_2158280 [compost metagenome]
MDRSVGLRFPAGWAVDQQALEGQVVQFDRPALQALQQLDVGIEGYALEAAALAGLVRHGDTPLLFWEL